MLRLLVLPLALGVSAASLAAAAPEIMTVTGPVPAAEAGPFLAHEHLMSIFGAEPAEPATYDDDALEAAVLPALETAHARGVRTIVEATTAWFGRDPARLRALSVRSGVHVVTNTGFYGAADGRYLPPAAHAESAGTIAALWLDEWRHGIGGSGVRPGFIKLAVNPGPLREVDRKLLRAAARVHLASGLTLATHTARNEEAAREQLAILAAEGVHASAWIWTHAHQMLDSAPLIDAARAGAWLSLDGVQPPLVARHVEHVLALREAGLLGRILLSHDGNLHPRPGAQPRGIDALFTHLRPALAAAGVTDAEWRAMTADNPARAFAIAVRPRD